MAISCIDGLTMIGHSHPHQQQANTNVYYYWWWWSQINHCVLVQPQEEEGSRSSAVEVFILVYFIEIQFIFILYFEPESPPIHIYKIQNPLLLPHTRAAAPKRPPGHFPGCRQREGNIPKFQRIYNER